jgi:hypothetical protein
VARTYEERVEDRPRRYTVLTEIRCDICGRKAKTREWGAASFEVNETVVSVEVCHRTGTQYPEGGSGEEFRADICPQCFTGELIPWLRSKGADIGPREWDW